MKQKKHKAKELENKSTIDEKNSINLKQISKGNANTASKNSPVTNSIDFHITKLVPENDTSESKNHVLLPSPYEDEVLRTQAAVSTNNANTNNNTVNDTNSILKPFTTATATNNRIDNENRNSNVVDDSNKLLKPTSTSTTTTNNNTNNVNINNSENNTSRNLIRSSIDKVRNESEKCGYAYAAKQDAKEKIPVLNSDQWEKGTILVVGDSMLAGLREAKLSKSKTIKVRYFPGGKTEDLQYHLIPYLKKKPDNIIIHVGTNDSPYKTEDLIYKELLNVKQTINKFHPNCKNIVISSPIVRTERNEANNILKRFNTILKQEEKNVIFHNNILASHLHRDGLHLNLNGTIMLAGNLLSRIRSF